MLLISINGFSQSTKKVCFLGNSYTYFNDLPQLVADLATADGNTLIKDQSTPGGYTFNLHTTNATSLAKISSDTWDYVVLQEQSQLPSFGWLQVASQCLPYAEILVDSIRSANACAVPLFFNTWGRRDGDPQWDSIDTFTEMNQRLHYTYNWLADEHSGKLSPVGIGFEHIANDGGSPIAFTALYSGDGSHPSVYGSYLAACIFYEIIFDTDVNGNTFFPGSITPTEAAYLQGVANHVVNDVDSVQIDYTQPFASFSYNLTGGFNVSFTNLSEHAFSYSWDFGDGNNSTEENPVHAFSGAGPYTVTLTAEYCGNSDDTTITIAGLSNQEYDSDPVRFYPNPSVDGNVYFNLTESSILSVFSIDGSLVRQESFSQGSHTLELQPGVYLIRINGIKPQKVIIY